MEKVSINFENIVGKIKPMHAVNNGPTEPSMSEQTKCNFNEYKAARIPYARNHDASFCSSYGGEHSVDVCAIFTDFNNNPYDPRSYDFALTDDYLKTINDAGTEVFYRLGSKIEHWRKKYWTIVPADFNKWAVVCEHIIRHYTQGWADGFHYKMEYWEIWNEPDGIAANGDQPNWSGTPEQFYEFYNVAAKHLKKCFPNLKIGGPAFSWVKHEEWLDGFLASIKADGVAPLDFFSWHSYQEDPRKVISASEFVRKKLDDAGFTNTENILNEWNYLENWTDKFVDTIQAIIGIRGAAFTSSVMSMGQKSSIDMLMYYDARIISSFNGMFDFYTLKPLKGYYPFYMFADLYELKNEVESTTSHDDVFVVAAADDTKKAAMVTYYSVDKSATDKEVEIDLGCSGEWTVKTLDEEKTMEAQIITAVDNKITVTMKPSTVLFVSKKN